MGWVIAAWIIDMTIVVFSVVKLSDDFTTRTAFQQ